MIVTQHNPWFVRGNAQAKQVLNRLLNDASFNDADTAAVQTQAWTPRVDVREEATRFVIVADLPGIAPTEIEIQMDKGVLSLKGERKAEAIGEGSKLARSERLHGRFDRRFSLPDSADAEAISASGKHGVLVISIPKKAAAAPRRIAINA